MRVQTARRVAVLGMLVTCALAPRAARADDVEIEARASYDRGLAAHDRGDEETAAHEFARADDLKPSSAALEAAVASCIRSSDAVFGMSLVERAKGRDLDAAAQSTIARARSAFAARVVTVVVDCDRARTCTLSVDGGAMRDAFDRAILSPGSHEVVVARDESSQKLVISAQGGEVVRIATESHQSSPPPAEETTSDWMRPVAFGAIGVSLVLAGVTVASLIDMRAKRSDFEGESCGSDAAAGTAAGPDCARFADAGRAAQTRTNLFLVASLAAGVGTAAFVIFAKPFASKSDVRITASLAGTGALLSIHAP